MINEQHVKLMTKMEIFEDKEMQECLPMAEYYRSDYVSKHIIISVFTGTFAFLLLSGLLLTDGLEDLLYSLDFSNLRGIIGVYLLWYLLFMGIYLLVTFVVYHTRYTAGRKKLRKMYQRLSLLEKIYEKEEQQTRPTGGNA